MSLWSHMKDSKVYDTDTHGHPDAAVRQVLVLVSIPHEPHVSLQADTTLHSDQTPPSGQQHPEVVVFVAAVVKATAVATESTKL